MRIAAVIPARKGSQRLPGKNKLEVGGVQLWKRAVNVAMDTPCRPIVVTTDDEEIEEQCASPSIIVVKQPQFPQTYNVMLEVVNHVDTELCKRGLEMHAFCLLQPTSPLRTAEDVLACTTALDSVAFDAAVTVTEAPDDIVFERRFAGRLEKLPQLVRPNGAVYVVRAEVLRDGGSWYGDHTYSHVMPKERSIDVDTAVDLELARLTWDKLYGSA